MFNAREVFAKPNQITIIRVLLIPIFVYFLLSSLPYREYIAAFIFVVLSLSDALDGYIARKRKEVTELGKLIDPIADKLLISTALIFLIGKGIPAWMAVVIILRESIITGLRLIFVAKGEVVSASILGKLKTISQTIAIILVILNFKYSWYAMLIAVLFTIISGFDYLVKFSNLIKDRVVNVPNLITLTRLLLIPLFIIYILNYNINVAILIFALIALGDKLDGISARVTKQITEFGSAFDSFTDWTFVIATTLTFVYTRYISIISGILLVIPLFIIAIIKLYYLRKYNKTITPIISKITVGIGYITIATILLNFVYKNVFLIVTIVMVYVTLAAFAVKAMAVPNKAAGKSKLTTKGTS